ncbi:uncharacterized protein LOC119401720 [Rhipicephalus sanguineus]|uniref:uncharacterized protein LOC119401720 n=1 Tax=Rhipicephalus sanguineus TaxID=34632 RepID=UPI0020C4722C|nr:uncharacterized protein LOC119401720 [Rhipicephalus sanguineus]
MEPNTKGPTASKGLQTSSETGTRGYEAFPLSDQLVPVRVEQTSPSRLGERIPAAGCLPRDGHECLPPTFVLPWQPDPNIAGQKTLGGASVSAMAKGWVSLLAVCVAGFTVLFQNEVDQDRWVASQAITLKASASDAFRFVTSSEYMSKWLPFVSSVFEADGKQMSVGKRYRATYELPLIGEVDTWYSVVEYQPHRRVAVEIHAWSRAALCKQPATPAILVPAANGLPAMTRAWPAPRIQAWVGVARCEDAQRWLPVLSTTRKAACATAELHFG